MDLTIKGFRVATLTKAVFKEVLDDNVFGLAAQTAYYFFFSLFPILLFVTPLIGLFIDPAAAIQFLEQQLGQAVPPESMAMIEGIIESVVLGDSAPGLASVGGLLALWAGSNVFNTLANALNRAYDIPEGRPWWKTRLIAIAMVVLAGIVMVTAFTTFMAGERIIAWVAGLVGLGGAATIAWLIAQYVLVIGFLVGLAWLQYYFLPNTRQDKKKVLVGALVATALWIAATLAFRAYVVNFGNYNATYGTIGAVIVLLTWMYISMVVVLIGGELNSELHKGTGAVKPRGGTLYAGRVTTGGQPASASVK